MAIRESLYFMYDNIDCRSFGIININLQSGMQEEGFLAKRTIKEEKIKGRDDPYFMGIEYEPNSFQLSFAFTDRFDTDKLRAVARWLSAPAYRPMVFEGLPDRIYYAMVTDDPKLVHNCLQQGYVTLNFRCNSPWSFSPVYESPVYDFSINDSNGKKLTFENIGDLPTRPWMQVEVVSGTGFKIINTSNGGQFIEFTGLTSGEIIALDNERRSVDSNLELTYRYENMSDGSKFLEMLFGNNYLMIYGNVRLKIKHQCAYIG